MGVVIVDETEEAGGNQIPKGLGDVLPLTKPAGRRWHLCVGIRAPAAAEEVPCAWQRWAACLQAYVAHQEGGLEAELSSARQGVPLGGRPRPLACRKAQARLPQG